MIEFLMAVAGVVTVAATVCAWIADRLTSEQRQRHEDLRRRRDAAQAACEDELQRHEDQSAQSERAYALQIKGMLADECARNLAQSAPLERDLPALRLDLERQLKQEHISAFKRNALRMLQTRIDDAIARLRAFQAYCAWYSAELERLEQAADYAALINFDLPEAKLPAAWFYVGKVGIVERDELNERVNRFDQVLKLTQVKAGASYVTDGLELALAQSYPDQEAIPVQLVHANKSGRFFSASVLRGALYVDHILAMVPCKALVERVERGQGYQVRCYPAIHELRRDSALQGGVTARLARSEARCPGKTYQPGDLLEVYPLYYDLLLTDRRGAGAMTVTERPESLDFEHESAAPVYLCVDHGQPHLAELAIELEGDAPWCLRSCRELPAGRLQIDFQLGAWLVRTTSDAADNFLVVHEIVAGDVYALEQTSLPFELQPIERAYLGDVFIDAERCRHLRHFCLQQDLYEQRGAERERAWEFFARWTRVAEYLLDVDGHLTVGLNVEGNHEGRLVVSIDADGEQQFKALEAQVESDAARGRRSRFRLEMACLDQAGAHLWLQVAEPNALPSKAVAHYELDIGAAGEQALQVARFGFTPQVPTQLRLRARKGGDYQNLIRQRQALEAFALDKLLNKSIKQILVDPAGYRGQASAHWEGKVAAGLAWRNANWRKPGSATSSKRVIEQALVESNLFLIQGPPGTGKTTSIVELLHQLYDDNPQLRILVVSQQNAAVDNALTRFLKDAPQFSERVLRVGKPEKMDESLRPCGSDARLQTYYEGRVAAFQRAAARDGEVPALLQDWLGAIRDDDKRFDPELSELLVGEYKLVGATCVGLAGQRHGMHRLQFDVAIIDEAGRSTVPELLIPMLRARKVILIGDHFQLPPSIAATLREEQSIAELPFLEEVFLKESFFEIMFRSLPPACHGRLDQQFRMVEPIGDLVAELFYSTGGQRGLFNGMTHERRDFYDAAAPLRWQDIHGVQEEEGTSKCNRAEAEAIVAWLGNAAARLHARNLHKEVAVITPYGAQKRLIRRLLDRASSHAGEDQDVRKFGSSLSIRIDTVDSFQGSDADIVLYSTVRTAGEISFIVDRQRLNVSCSRAKENLVFFGHASFLTRAEARMRDRERRPLFSAILQRAELEAAVLTVQVQHIPKADSAFMYLQHGTTRYFAHFGVAGGMSRQEWRDLKVGDTLEITVSDEPVPKGKCAKAASVKKPALPPAPLGANSRGSARRSTPVARSSTALPTADQ
jgi:DNA polymerase III delta prime subunit